MIRVLIVDDEYLLRKYIFNTINWTALDMEVIGEARDGEQAIRLIREMLPDIVLTDINMPNVNGVQLAKYLQKQFPNICVIIITGYGEFEYAKDAVNAGVFGYLLKPINEQEYTEILLSAKKEIQRKQTQQSLASQAENYRYSQKRIFNFKRLITETLSEEEALLLLTESLIPLNAEGLCVISIKWETLNHSMADPEYHETAQKDLKAQLTAHAFYKMNIHIFENAPDELVILANLTPEERNITLVNRLEALCISLEADRFLKLFVGISRIENGFSCLPSLYLQAKKALKSKFILANCKVLLYGDGDQADTSLPSQYFDANLLLILLRQNDRVSVQQYLEQTIGKMTQERVSKETCIFVSLMLLSVLNEFLSEKNKSLGYQTNELIDIVSEKSSLVELKAFVMMLFDKTLEETSNDKKNTKHEKVEQALQYIQAHYMDTDLSLNTVSASLFINASYLCSLFKREMNITLVEYINNYRLDISKKMIAENQSLTIAEAAYAVGYSSEYYFMRCFKKRFGISPKIYQRTKA